MVSGMFGGARKMPVRIGITGSPGTGKKTIGVELARIAGLEFLSLNDFAINNRLGGYSPSYREFIVDIALLRRHIAHVTKGKIICGHLLPYVVPKSKLDFVVVLRCSPDVLRKRYLQRRYSLEKIRENIEAEMIGLIAEKSLRVYGVDKLAEFDTSRTKNPQTIAKRILWALKEKKRRSFGALDWLVRSNPGMLESLLTTLPIENQKG